RLLSTMDSPRAVIGGCSLMMKAAEVMKVPMLVTEQYPEGLGATVGSLAELAPEQAFFAKVDFSSLENTAIKGKIDTLKPKQIVIAGIEAHVCVLQTTVGLLDAGYQCFVVGDATSSRTAANHAAGLARLREAGAEIVTSEMVVFEWLQKSGTPEFRDLSRLLK
ncbi:MAG: isochorismatase family protein, partial [Pseudomonadota bacterium]|nr:isochorismatase family protein [Pseudomonadota bacterium]